MPIEKQHATPSNQGLSSRREAGAPSDTIRVFGARQHNLRGLDVEIPRGSLTVVTGVSGSGKSSLAFDTLYREGQRRYLESLSSRARQLLGKLERPAVDRIEGIAPALAVSQKAVVSSPRSTVGTLSELYDHLRLLFARVGIAHCFTCGEQLSQKELINSACGACGVTLPKLDSSLFSFNLQQGACPACKGLGVEDRVDPELLVADPSLTLRQGALVPTTPKGYIVYSQVTVDVLDTVCQAHGFSVDQPWGELEKEQQKVVLYGSDRIRVPFGKHPLESRMRWKGITARPRKEGIYRGIIPVIEEILARSRNRNALRFVRTGPCRSCTGARLRPEALAFQLGSWTIAEWASLTIADATRGLGKLVWEERQQAIAGRVISAFESRAELVESLGLGHLTLDRRSPTLSAGEVQRLRLTKVAGSGLRGLLFVLDEPTVGLHPRDIGRLLDVLFRLRDAGNTIVVVEHDPQVILAADELIDIGPGAGEAGGELLYAGPPRELLDRKGSNNVTRVHLENARQRSELKSTRSDGDERADKQKKLWVRGARENNLRGIDVPFLLGALNVVGGISGAGKTTLVDRVLGRALRQKLHGASARPGAHEGIDGAELIDKLIVVDQAPIGRTPRSNPATFTRAFEGIRGCFAALSEAEARGWNKGHFSFNVAGGRCERCHGAGVETVGMHFLGDVEVTCPDCGGARFDDETLAVRYRGFSVLEVLRLSVDRARELFSDKPKVRRILDALKDVGLGYLPLGQPSTTLSGGEAQRVKLAAELGRPSTGATLVLLDEPTRGLHGADVERLLDALQGLVRRGNTVIAIEHDPLVIGAADWVVDLGPEGGRGGGRLVVAGPPERVAAKSDSLTGAVLRGEGHKAHEEPRPTSSSEGSLPIKLGGVSTHNLRAIDVEIPFQQLTAITGVSGSGKSTLAFDTLYDESRVRFSENLTTATRRRIGAASAARIETSSGLTPALGIGHRRAARNPRSTVGTMTESLDGLRLLMSRVGVPHCPGCGPPLIEGRCAVCDFVGTDPLLAAHFSFNDQRGACPLCRGLGTTTSCDPTKLITDPSRSILDGAIDGTGTGRYYGDRHGRYVALLRTVGRELEFDFDVAWEVLDEEARRIALNGTGEREFDVEWRYLRGRRSGTHRFRATWDGLIGYVDEEYSRKHADKRGEAMLPLMMDAPCRDCGGSRLAPEPRAVRFDGKTLSELEGRSVDSLVLWVDELDAGDARTRAVSAPILADFRRRLEGLQDAGLGYLTLARTAPSLSGGEHQRARLAAQLCSKLWGVTYVLDEPTVGLHVRDVERLLSVLRRLVEAGNTVVMVEHDLRMIRAADHVIELGPGAGAAGGRVVAAGPPESLLERLESPTGAWLRRDGSGSGPRVLRPGRPGIRIEGATARNLRGLDLDLPSRALIAVTGVSGAGKSALMFDVLAPSIEEGSPLGCDGIDGVEIFDSLVAVDATPPTGSSRATPATYGGAFDLIRGLFARSEVARERSWGKGWFSTTARGGRCEACAGSGRQEIEMGFLAPVILPCDVCDGSRYSTATLEARVEGLSIADVLALSIDEATAKLGNQRKLASRLRPLVDVGLGYLPLGQSLDTLSAGELQRLKLSAGLSPKAGGTSLFLLDEPTCGLHAEDVSRLLEVLQRLVEEGHTVLVIEHDLQVIRDADWVIDLGPEGGDGGGTLVVAGTPAEIAAHSSSHTGMALREA